MLKLILASFDYGKDGIARVILAKALTAAPLVCFEVGLIFIHWFVSQGRTLGQIWGV